MATKTLEELKDKLYKAFDDAIERSDNWGNSGETRAQNLIAAGRIAESITKVEERIDARNEAQNGMKLPGKL
ncbi:MAG: hypothetical protein GC185_12880 [Alphaproteobacteria bacterium]|nr:hypothetical protein [Alphaproteobacteria bacterium]